MQLYHKQLLIISFYEVAQSNETSDARPIHSWTTGQPYSVLQAKYRFIWFNSTKLVNSSKNVSVTMCPRLNVIINFVIYFISV